MSGIWDWEDLFVISLWECIIGGFLAHKYSRRLHHGVWRMVMCKLRYEFLTQCLCLCLPFSILKCFSNFVLKSLFFTHSEAKVFQESYFSYFFSLQSTNILFLFSNLVCWQIKYKQIHSMTKCFSQAVNANQHWTSQSNMLKWRAVHPFNSSVIRRARKFHCHFKGGAALLNRVGQAGGDWMPW